MVYSYSFYLQHGKGTQNLRLCNTFAVTSKQKKCLSDKNRVGGKH